MVIPLVSLALLVYWFRCTCLLILRTKAAKDYARGVVTVNNLRFPEIGEQLIRGAHDGELDQLHDLLARDYRLLTYLLRHTAGFEAGGLTIEQRLLALDFRLMQAWYALGRRLGISQTRKALDEMANILSHFAQAMGKRATVSSRA